MTYELLNEVTAQLVRLTATDGDYPVGTFAIYEESCDNLWILLPEDYNNGIYNEDPLEVNGELFRTSLWGYISCLLDYGYSFEVIEEFSPLELSHELLSELTRS